MATPASQSTPGPNGVESFLRRYSTQATAALGVVVGVTGIMMFFHVAKGEVEGVHEWLGLAFAAAAILHVLRHRHGFSSMLRQPRMQVLAGAAALVTVAFLVLTPAKQGNPARLAIQMVMRAPISEVAPLVGVSSAELASRLGATDPSHSLETLARAQGTDPMKLLETAMRK